METMTDYKILQQKMAVLMKQKEKIDNEIADLTKELSEIKDLNKEITVKDLMYSALQHNIIETRCTFQIGYSSPDVVFNGKCFYANDNKDDNEYPLKSKADIIADYGENGLAIELTMACFGNGDYTDSYSYGVPILTEKEFLEKYEEKYPFIESLDLDNDLDYDYGRHIQEKGVVSEEQWKDFRKDIASDIAEKIQTLPNTDFKENLISKILKEVNNYGIEYTLVDEELDEPEIDR